MSLASGGIGLRTTGSVPRAGQHSPIAYGSEGMISAADPIAARVGIDVLESGGNAVDAAIAVASVENVTLPAMCGLGGDVFAIVYEASTGRCTAINGSGVCAYKATPEYFLERGLRKMPISGLYSVAVPGAVHAYETIAKPLRYSPVGRPFAAGHRDSRTGIHTAGDNGGHYLWDGPHLGSIPDFRVNIHTGR